MFFITRLYKKERKYGRENWIDRSGCGGEGWAFSGINGKAQCFGFLL